MYNLWSSWLCISFLFAVCDLQTFSPAPCSQARSVYASVTVTDKVSRPCKTAGKIACMKAIFVAQRSKMAGWHCSVQLHWGLTYPRPCTDTHSCPQRSPGDLWGRIPTVITASSIYNVRPPPERQKSDKFWGRPVWAVCQPAPGRARRVSRLDADGSEVRQDSYHWVSGKGRLASPQLRFGRWVSGSFVPPLISEILFKILCS